MAIEADYRICKALAREGDRDRYVAALFAPAGKRRHLFALVAFNTEIARIRDLVSEPMLGEVRLQWWRDAIEGGASGDASGSPVANALADTIRRCELPRALLRESVDARAFDLYSDPMATLPQLETYLDSTSGSLVRLAAEILGGEETPEIAGGAAHAGRAYGIASLLGSFAPDTARGRIYLPPLDVLARHGSNAGEAVSGAVTPGLAAALREMRDLARFHLAEARKHIAALPKAVLPAFLPAELVPAYLERMESPGSYDPFRTRIEISPWRRPWTLWRAARRRT